MRLCFVTHYYSPLNFNCITGIRLQLRSQINSVFLKINWIFLFLHGSDFPVLNIHSPDLNILDFCCLIHSNTTQLYISTKTERLHALSTGARKRAKERSEHQIASIFRNLNCVTVR